MEKPPYSKLSPHRHSGRRLPHGYTNYPVLLFLVMFLGVALLAVTSSAIADPGSLNASYSVKAIVPGPAPQFPAVITSPHNGQSINGQNVLVTGTCNVGSLVRVYKNQVFSGSVFCSANATFALTIDLFAGKNDLTALNFDSLEQAGPISPTVTVFVTLPGASSVNSNSASGTSRLMIQGSSPFVAYRPGEQASWKLNISGGVAPYAVQITWGDHKTDLLSIGQAGDFTISHVYDQPGPGDGDYQVVVEATDTVGATASVQLGAKVVVAGAGSARPEAGGSLLIAWPLFVLALLMVLGFWLGEVKERHREMIKLAT